MEESSQSANAKRKKRNILFYILYAVAVLLFIGISLELILRIVEYPNTFVIPLRYKFHYKMAFDRRRAFRIVPHSGPEINNYGYRDYDFSLNKTAKKRILFYGDSFAMAPNVLPGQSMPKQLEKMLGAEYEVFNMGVWSYGPDNSWIQLIDEGLGFKPDMVVLAIYPTNDFNDMVNHNLFYLNQSGGVEFNPNNTVASALPKSQLAYFAEFNAMKYFKVYNGIAELFPTLIRSSWDYDFIFQNNPEMMRDKYDFMRALLREFKATLDKNGIPLLAVIVPNIANIEMHELYEQKQVPKDRYFTNEDIIQDICQKEAIPYLNFYKNFISSKPPEPLFDHEDWHLSPYGYNRASGLIYQYIKSHPLK